MKQRGFEPRLPLKNATASISLQKYTEAVKAKQEKVDPIEALELNDEIALWEGVKGILAERNGAAAPVTAAAAPVAENEMQPVEGVAQPVEGAQPTSAGSIESSSRQSEIGGTPSLLDVVRTLYSKGKEVASKLFQRSFFDVAQTPKFMQELGSRGDKFSIKYGVIARHLGKDSSHTLTERDWEQLPQALQNPFAISKLTDKEDSYRIYTTLQTESGEFVVVGADVKNAGREIEVNAISTVFGRRNNANLPKNGFSRNLLWITILSTTFPVLFYGYSLVVVFSSAFFFCEKKKQKTLHKRNCRKFPLLVPQECVHSVGYLLVIAANGCFKGAADRPQLATLRASN